MTPLEKQLAQTVTALPDDTAIQLKNVAAMLELLARRLPGASESEKSLFLTESRNLLAHAKTREDDADNLRASLKDLEEPDFPLN